MGQTLPNGIYLPAEGERNCYDGLEGNWRSLDSLISTVAGKASATHTHGNVTNDGKVGTAANKPLITGTDGVVQAGSFGNAANTFCEGNDSRLSDARTPVAHTHGKADITDLFNSANTWGGDNTYTKYLNALIDGCEIGVTPTSTSKNGILFKDINGVNIGWLRHQYDTSGDISIEMLVSNKYKNGVLDPTGTQVYQGVKQVITASGDSYFNWSGTLNNSAVPRINNTYDLGTSTNKWKSLNGINPGALSLPKTNTSITSLSVSGFSFDGSNERIPDTTNLFSNGEALVDGWLCARLAEGAGHYIFINSDDTTDKYGILASCFSSGVVSTLAYGINVYVPVKVGDKPAIRWAKPNGGNAQLIFYPCFGNV